MKRRSAVGIAVLLAMLLVMACLGGLWADGGATPYTTYTTWLYNYQGHIVGEFESSYRPTREQIYAASSLFQSSDPSSRPVSSVTDKIVEEEAQGQYTYYYFPGPN